LAFFLLMKTFAIALNYVGMLLIDYTPVNLYHY